MIVAKPIAESKKNRRGRPSTGGRCEGILVRFEPSQIAAVDSWAERQDEPATRPEAIRRLVEIGLAADHRSVEQLHEAKTHADLAAELAREMGLRAKK
jgi:hypothetical protein